MSRAIPDPIPAPGSQAGIHFSTAMFAQNFLGFLVSAAPKPGPILHGVRCSISYHTEIKQELFPSARALQHSLSFILGLIFQKAPNYATPSCPRPFPAEGMRAWAEELEVC